MKAIILAAGRGSRMKKLTDDKPKCLLKVNNKTLLELQIEALKKANIKDIAIVTGYKRELLKNKGIVEFFNDRWENTQMVTSLECAEEWIKSDDCIVSYSDIFYDSTAITKLIDCKENLAITYDPNWLELWQERFGDPLVDAETFKLDSYGKYLVEIGNKPKNKEEVQGQYMGLLKFTPTSWEEMTRMRRLLTDEEKDRMHMTHALQKIIEAKYMRIKAQPYLGKWGEIDSEKDYILYNQ